MLRVKVLRSELPFWRARKVDARVKRVPIRSAMLDYGRFMMQ